MSDRIRTSLIDKHPEALLPQSPDSNQIEFQPFKMAKSKKITSSVSQRQKQKAMNKSWNRHRIPIFVTLAIVALAILSVPLSPLLTSPRSVAFFKSIPGVSLLFPSPPPKKSRERRSRTKKEKTGGEENSLAQQLEHSARLIQEQRFQEAKRVLTQSLEKHSGQTSFSIDVTAHMPPTQTPGLHG